MARDPKLKTEKKSQLCNMGFDIISNTTAIQLKDIILTKLITLYPEDGTLYHRMAMIYKQENILEKTILWLTIGFQVDPSNIDTVLELSKIYLDLGLGKSVIEMNKNKQLEQFKEDSRFLAIFSRCHFQQLYYKDGIQIFLKLIKQKSSQKCITMEEKADKWSCYHDLGYVYSAFGEYEKSIEYTKKAVDLSLKFNLNIWNKLLSFSNLLCFHDYDYYNQDEVFKLYLKINEYLPDTPLFKFNTKPPSKKIKIGYLSSDYQYHSVTNFILPILKNHNREEFEIILYANLPDMVPEYKELNLKYYLIKNSTDKQAAELIYKEGIDILVDLNGHTVENRLGVFAYHPAPIQVSYLGFPNTTGLKGIQYRITDAIADNINTNQKYSEELLRLPKCFLLYKSFSQSIPTTPRKTNKTIILGGINKENKNTKYVLDTWRQILNACPDTKILLKLESFDNNEERMAFYMEKLDVDRKRIILLNKLSNEDYNKVFTMMDILLDTFPYSGTTTTCNALYNSIPVVSLYNKDYHAHNVSCSLLMNMGYPELVAKTTEEYISIVNNLVNNPSKIENYKENIKHKFQDLMEPKAFMKSYEDVLKDIYIRSKTNDKIEIDL